jgi:predicted Zn-dependent protease
MKRKYLFLSLFVVFAAQISLSAMAIFRITEQQEIAVGRDAANQVVKQSKLNTNKDVNAYITRVGNKLAQNSTRTNIAYNFRVIESSQINAFALPGGFIFIYSGLIKSADTENEFIGVLAHEVGHVAGHHSVQQIARAQKANLALGAAGLLLGGMKHGATLFNGAKLATQGVFLKFSRDHEREADRLGAQMMYNAGWNPNGMVDFFDDLAKKGNSGVSFFSTHPSPAERRSNISDLIASWGNKGTVDSPEFQKIKKLV